MSTVWPGVRLLGISGALVLAIGCGGGAASTRTSGAVAIGLHPTVALQTWYRSQSTCAQGPYELDLPVTGAKWGEDFELRVRTPRRIALHAVILEDDAEVEHIAGVFDHGGRSQGAAENTRCIADARERWSLGRAGSGGGGAGGGTPGTPATPGTSVPIEPPPTATAQLDLDTSLVTASTVVLHYRLRDRQGGGLPRIRIRFWSIEPNDLAGVLFGVARIEWRPNVSEAAYVEHLRAVAEREERERARRAEVARREHEAWQRRQASAPQVAPPLPRVEIDAEAELAVYRKREEARRRRAVEIALEAERRQRRKEFCAGRPDDRDCWGAGGLTVHLDLEQRQRERAVYCAATPDDARCWTDAERNRREVAWQRRVTAALTPPKPPDGPPPAALVEVVPPKLSLNADWRPGYWHWADGSWVWLAGMWRVPESDIAAEQTTTAPVAPPPVQVEVAPPAPIRTAVWLAGFWQWNGTTWVWIAGSWQLRPEARVTWRAPQWQPRGRVHVLIPGGWVRARIGGR